MKNYMTVEQLMICADILRHEADSYGRIAAESRENLEAIWNIPADARTNADLKKADMIEEEYKRRLDKQTATLILAEIIKGLKVEVILKTEEK